MEYDIYLDTYGVKAKGKYNLEKDCVTILEGSQIIEKEKIKLKSISEKNLAIYNSLISDETLIKDYVFLKNHEFNSISEAANVLLGTHLNGTSYFLLENGDPVSSIFPKGLLPYLEEHIDEKQYQKMAEEATSKWQQFQNDFPLDNLDKMSLTDYDQVGNKKSFMNTVENKTPEICNGNLGINGNKLFYQRKADKIYYIAKVIKNNPKYVGLEYEETFRIYLKELKEFINWFNLDTYNSSLDYPCKDFIHGANVLKLNFIILYKGPILTSFSTLTRIRKVLDRLKIEYGMKEDSIELNRKLTNYIFEMRPELKEYSLFQISACLIDYYDQYIESQNDYAVSFDDITQQQYFYDNKVFALSDNGVGDFEEYDSYDEIMDKFDKDVLNTFINLKKGDQLILQKSTEENEKATTEIYALGTVLEDYDEGYKFIKNVGHTIPVEWKILDETYKRVGTPYTKQITLLKGGELKKVINKFKNTDINEETSQVTIGTNIIYYGVPGCGKSYETNEKANELGIVERILFHPEYTYSDFVGQLLPKKHGDNDITYAFEPGPFTRILEKALTNRNEHYCLIIEEINRGNASAIFGDIFQLLDRLKEDKEGYKKGDSEYRIKNKAIHDYLKKQGVASDNEDIYIPSNLTIYATMNSSDQNVFPLDTAFKRRWQFKRIPNDFDKHPYRNTPVVGTDITWEKFVGILNQHIRALNKYGINGDDKQLGKFFLSQDELLDNDLFAEKVLLYLWEDVVKFKKDLLFREDYATLDELLAAFPNKKFDVFKEELVKDLKNNKLEKSKDDLIDEEQSKM